jgi:hypothetical protein
MARAQRTGVRGESNGAANSRCHEGISKGQFHKGIPEPDESVDGASSQLVMGQGRRVPLEFRRVRNDRTATVWITKSLAFSDLELLSPAFQTLSLAEKPRRLSQWCGEREKRDTRTFGKQMRRGVTASTIPSVRICVK